MNLAYIAAEYFVDAIAISRDYKISYEYVKILRNLIGKDISPQIAEYLDKKSKHDFLYIVKKFPDIFVVEEHLIGLTEPFLSLYNLNKFLITKRFHTVNCYVKNCAIEYFRKILMTQGPKPYFELFNMLMTDHTQKYAKYFLHFSMSDIYNFFLAHSNYFTVIHKSVVFLTARNPVLPYSVANDHDDTEAMKIFEISVYFLLTCYKSMHYFHLKQCLSYVHASTKQILEQISLVRQRELFAILPVATMDATGFVSLKNKEISVALPDVIKTILLLVCILAFKKELYIVDLVAEFSNRMLPAVNHFSDLTFEEQIDFMGQYPMYFHISYTGHISLLPGFILPECPFPQPSERESDLQTVERNVIIGTDGSPFSDDSNAAKNVYLPNSFPFDMPKNRSSTITSHAEQIQNVLPPIDLCSPGLSEITIERIKQSLFYLSKHFYPLDKKHAMQTLLHSIDDVRVSFCSFSDKCKFITECCNFINSLSEEYLETTAGSINELLTEKEKHVLFIIYIMSSNESIHFLVLIETMKQHEMDNILLRSTVSDQIKYFKTLSGYIEVYSDGQIIFPATFFPIKSIIDSYSNLFSEFSERVSQDKKPSSRKVLLRDREPTATKTKSEDKKPLMTFKNRNAKLSKTLSWVADVVPLEPKSSNTAEDNVSSYINAPVVLPDTICRTLSHCAKLLSKYYECAATIHILKATLFSFSDIYNYLLNLPMMSDQYAFAEKCFKYLNKENHSYSSPLSSEEREILFITYMLLNSEEERMHYRKIVIELSACHCKRMSKLKVDRSQFWYFKNADKYFVINSDGYVTLSSSFNYINVLVNVAINRTAKSPGLLKESVHKSTKFHKISPKQPAMKNVMAVEMPAHSSSNYSSVKNRNSKKLEATESQFEMQETSAERINIDDDTRDLIIDIMFFFLPLCGKMSIEKLCYRLNSFDIKGVHNMFSSYTITEKLNFFKSLSSYFVVSKDGFVSLKEDAAKTFVPKTDVNLSELFKKNNPTSERSSSVPRSRSESVKSTDVSESSVKVSTASDNNVTKRGRRPRSGSKKHENTHNKISYEVHKVTDKAHSPKLVKKDFHNSNLDLQLSHSESALKTSPSSPVSKENECNAMKDINKNDELSQSTPEIEIIMEIKGTKNKGLLPEADSRMSVDQVPELCDKKEKEGKFDECQSNSTASPLEKAKMCALSISEDILKLKVPRQPFKESMSSKSSKSSLTLLENTSENNKQNEVGGSSSSMNNLNQISLVNDCEPAVCKTLEVKSNLPNASERATVSLPDTENISSFKEIDEALQTCSMPLGDNFHNDLKNDSSYQAYISDLIDEFLYSAKTNPSDLGSSNLNNEHKASCVSDKDPISGLTSAAAAKTTELKYHYSWKLPDDKKDSSSNSTSELKSETQDLPKCIKVFETVPHQSLVPILKNCDKTPDVPNSGVSNKPEPLTAQRDSDPVEVADFERVIEDRAVTFFILMLKSYQKYDESISVDFLKKHISQASAEVQSFMLKHYGHDYVPFFQKHKKVFYVSPITRCVYLVRKSSQKLRKHSLVDGTCFHAHIMKMFYFWIKRISLKDIYSIHFFRRLYFDGSFKLTSKSRYVKLHVITSLSDKRTTFGEACILALKLAFYSPVDRN